MITFEGLREVVHNLQSSYFLAISTLIAASLVALFYGIKNAQEEEVVTITKNGKTTRKKKTPGFYLPCSLNQECLFEDEDAEEESDGNEDAKNTSSKAFAAEKKILSELTPEELQKEQITQQIQLSEIYQLMQDQGEKFGETSFAELEEQMKIYRL